MPYRKWADIKRQRAERTPLAERASVAADRYTYQVIWSEDEQEFVGLCAEMPRLSHGDETREAAWRGITDLVTAIVADMLAKGETLPAVAVSV